MWRWIFAFLSAIDRQFDRCSVKIIAERIQLIVDAIDLWADTYQKGQRWEFNDNVPEFEKTFVIGNIRPEWWGRQTARPTEFGWHEKLYEIYIRYSESAKKSLWPKFDGVVLCLTQKGLGQNATKLVETDVELPSWWASGREHDSNEKASWGRSSRFCDRVSDVLPELFDEARRTSERLRRRAEAIEQHISRQKSAILSISPSKSVEESWKRILGWLGKNAPDFTFFLNHGADESTISDFERAIDFELPEDFKKSWRLHDGGECWIMPNHGQLLSLEQMLEKWNMYRSMLEEGTYAEGQDWIPDQIEGPIKPVFWNPKRIFITDNSGDHLTLDLDPPENGVYGQIVHHSHEVGPCEVIAPSWSAFLAKMVDDLESGKYVYFDHDGSLELLDWVQRGYR